MANSSSNTLSLFQGNGAGGFGAASSFSTGNQPRSVAIADLNGDGKPDFVIPNYGSNSLTILLNQSQ